MNNKTEKFVNSKNYHHFAAVAYVVATLGYLSWLFLNLNISAWYVAFPFFFAQLYMFLLVALSIRNHWNAKYRTKRPNLPNSLPSVSVVVTTKGESIDILRKTLKSLLHIHYKGEVVILLSNDDQNIDQRNALKKLMKELCEYWIDNVSRKEQGTKKLYLVNTKPHKQYKAGNLNQAVGFLRKHFSHIDYIYTQDADEFVHPEIVNATIGYFTDNKISFVQTIKQSAVSGGDPFGNQDFMWYGRTAAARDNDNAMFACGSGVVWKISAVESVGGFNTWNLVEDLTTSYELLAKGWSGRYHYEALSKGIAPEDLANFVKQRGTWAIDTMRIFFWNNPLFKKGLNWKQKLQFLETPLFYINGFATITLVITTSLSLLFTKWPTTKGALEHAYFLLPSFLALEAYFLLLGDKIFFRRVRQFWAGLSPVFVMATIKALVNGPNKKPKYVVTRKENEHANYIKLVWPQITLLSLIVLSLVKTIIATPLYSAFDWAVVFWGLYQASFFVQVIRVSFWKYTPSIEYSFQLEPAFEIYDKAKRGVENIVTQPQYAFAKAASYASAFALSILFFLVRKRG